jgi:hypothetical protein
MSRNIFNDASQFSFTDTGSLLGNGKFGYIGNFGKRPIKVIQSAWGGDQKSGCQKSDIAIATIDAKKRSNKTLWSFTRYRSEVIEWIIRNQFGRRNLSSYIRTTLALRLESEIAGRAKKNQARKPADFVKQNSAEQTETRKELAKLAGVSHNTVDKVKKIELVASPKTKEALAKGEMHFQFNQNYQKYQMYHFPP